MFLQKVGNRTYPLISLKHNPTVVAFFVVAEGGGINALGFLLQTKLDAAFVHYKWRLADKLATGIKYSEHQIILIQKIIRHIDGAFALIGVGVNEKLIAPVYPIFGNGCG